MALHPQAQVRLLRKLDQIASEKNLTVIFSTHSSTLIKTHQRRNILFLKETNIAGEYEVKKNMFPAQILGELAFDDELGLDFLFYVEDPQAKMLLHQMINYYFSHQDMTGRIHPLYKIIYVGGSKEVVKMLSNSSQIFPSFIKRFAFLDDDVRTDTIPHTQDPNILSLYHQNGVKFLPCTPEVGLMEIVERNNGTYIQGAIVSYFSGHRINIEQIINSAEYFRNNQPNIRKKAKARMEYLVNEISRITGEQNDNIYSILYKIYCEKKYSPNIGSLNQIFGPIFN